MNDFLFQVFLGIVTSAIFIITYYAIPWLKTQIHESQYKEVVEVVAQAVRCAEQTIRKSGSGALKKEQVLTFLESWLSQRGIKITSEQLNQLIEAAVYAMKQE